MNKDTPSQELAAASLKLGEEKPLIVTSLGIMLLLGALVALAMGVLSASTVVLLLWPGTYFSFALAAIAGMKGFKLLGSGAADETPPKTIACLQIANGVMVLDFVNLVLGVAVLILLSTPEVKSYFRSSNANRTGDSNPPLEGTKETKPGTTG